MTHFLEIQDSVRKDVARQVDVQIHKWNVQYHTQDEWMAVLKEEIAEFVCKVIVAKEDGYAELIHVAAVVEAWLVNIQLNREAQK